MDKDCCKILYNLINDDIDDTTLPAIQKWNNNNAIATNLLYTDRSEDDAYSP